MIEKVEQVMRRQISSSGERSLWFNLSLGGRDLNLHSWEEFQRWVHREGNGWDLERFRPTDDPAIRQYFSKEGNLLERKKVKSKDKGNL